MGRAAFRETQRATAAGHAAARLITLADQ